VESANCGNLLKLPSVVVVLTGGLRGRPHFVKERFDFVANGIFSFGETPLFFKLV
jgi:hypothetical protein